ncbi:PLC-like phosphodiesterase [Ganoderma leucocontextum]|nr:PLC-like phosphodiesterase [Ganoderma leucocontextum]
MAFYGWPFSQCQSLATSLGVQLASGIRVIDIRLAVVDGHLIAYHGIWPERTPFQQMLTTVHDFLTSPLTSSETVVMSIKQEDFAKTALPYFSQCVHDEIMGGPGGRDMWFLENRIPNLGEVRGKVVMLSRFGGDGSQWENGLEGLGIHPTAWPDSDKDGFTWTLNGTLVRTQDWYDIPSFLSIPKKMQLASENLLLPTGEQPSPTLNISFFSAASIPFALPTTVARGFGWPKWHMGIEGVNGRVGKWLLDNLTGSGDQTQNTQAKSEEGGTLDVSPAGNSVEDDVRIRGWAMMDFYADPGDSVVPLLVECNFHGRKSGEEGWP